MSAIGWAPRWPGQAVALRLPLARWRARRAVWIVAIGALTALALALRWRALDAPLWIDEGISIGISSHPLAAIPGLLHQDGSPPLYYLLLHLWMSAFGTNAGAAHALSIVLSALGVPAAGWAAWRPFGRRAGLIAAALAAFNPFLATYADEVRMYTLTFVLAALATGAFLRAFLLGERRFAVAFGVLLASLCLTHNWGLLYGLAAVPAFACALAARPGARRRMLVDGAIAAGLASAIFAPWVTTLLFQSAHTGAPWSAQPDLADVGDGIQTLLGGLIAAVLLPVLATAGLFARRRGLTLRGEGWAMLALVVLSLGTLLGGFALSVIGQPAWALRYLAVVLAPMVVLLGVGLARAGLLGVLAVAGACLGLWLGNPSPHALEHKSNVVQLATALSDEIPQGTLIASPQPEEVPVLRYYLGPGYRYVTPLGVQRDPRVVDWIDALRRLRRSTVANTLAPVVDRLRPGQRLLLIQPRYSTANAPWTLGILHREERWRAWLEDRSGLRVVALIEPGTRAYSTTVGAILLQRPA